MPTHNKISIEQAIKKCNKHKIKIVGKYVNGSTKTEFKCFCGNIFITLPSRIFNNRTRSCGCRNQKARYSKLKNLCKKRFGKLKVIKLLPKDGQQRKYLCKCDCGNYKEIKGLLLRRGTKSCGCITKLDKIGEKHHSYNVNLTDEDRKNNRNSSIIIRWRNKIFNIHGKKCYICYSRIKIIVHHLDGWHWCKERRLDVTNGIPLCEKCHKEFHKKYGRKNNTEQQFKEFKNGRKKKIIRN